MALLLAFATPAFGQIFPGIEREDVLKRAPGGAEQPDTPKPDAAGKVDGAAALKRYNELLTGWMNGRSDQRKLAAPFTDKVHESVRKYIEAHHLLRLGYYDEAAKAFDSVGYTVRKDDAKAAEIKKVAADIKAGRALYFRMIAVVMQDYREFKDEKELDAAWERTRKKGEAIVKECQTLAERKRIEDQSTWRQMDGWLGMAKGLWRRFMAADQGVQQRPNELASWVALLNSTGPTASATAENEMHCCLKRRAAARVIKEFWPASEPAIDGTADIALATSHFMALQFDDYGQYLVTQPYHNDVGKAALDDFAEKARKALEELQKLRE